MLSLFGCLIVLAMGAGEETLHRPLRLDMAEALLQRVAVMPQHPSSALAENMDILRATAHRVAFLEALLKERESQLDSARQDVAQLQVAQSYELASVIQSGHISCLADCFSVPAQTVSIYLVPLADPQDPSSHVCQCIVRQHSTP